MTTETKFTPSPWKLRPNHGGSLDLCAEALLEALDRELPYAQRHIAACERFNLRVALAIAKGVTN
ncbi:MAG: hypothetical protein ACK443_05845 [Methylococcaceae bacterium]|jgi:hypothetical protein